MADVLRTFTLPSEGYGDEPKSEADVLLTAAARIQAALPTGWTVQAKTEVGGLMTPPTLPAAPTHGSLSCEKGRPC